MHFRSARDNDTGNASCGPQARDKKLLTIGNIVHDSVPISQDLTRGCIDCLHVTRIQRLSGFFLFGNTSGL